MGGAGIEADTGAGNETDTGAGSEPDTGAGSCTMGLPKGSDGWKDVLPAGLPAPPPAAEHAVGAAVSCCVALRRVRKSGASPNVCTRRIVCGCSAKGACGATMPSPAT